MLFRTAALLYFALSQPLLAQQASYLTEPARFATALAQITTKTGPEVEVGYLAFDDDELVMFTRAPGSGSSMLRWHVKDVEVFGLHVNQLTGPEPLDTNGNTNFEGSLFRLSQIPLDRLPLILSRAERHVRFDSPVRSGNVRIGRRAADSDPTR